MYLINGKGKLCSSKPLGSYKDKTKLKTLSIDFKTGKIVSSQSTIIKQKESKDFYKVKLMNGEEIICSLDHKLFVQRNKHVIELKLSEIKVGDKICIKES